MKRILLGMILGALLGAGGVKAHEVYTVYDNDDLMRKLKQVESDVGFVASQVGFLTTCPCSE